VAALQKLLYSLVGWVSAALLFFLPRDKCRFLVISRPAFLDNSKHFFTYLNANLGAGQTVTFLSSNEKLCEEIRASGGKAVKHPSLHSLWMVRRSGALITDVSAWGDYGVYPLSRGSLCVQMWHGAPLKHIELDVFKKRLQSMSTWMKYLLTLYKKLSGRYPNYDVVLCTSQQFLQIFVNCFRARTYLTTGYPRNDAMFSGNGSGSALMDINVDLSVLDEIKLAKQANVMVVLYVPTFRKGLENPLNDKLEIKRLSGFALANNMTFIVKLHPFMVGLTESTLLPGVIICNPDSDIYPLMKFCDLMVTDYSSIYLDFLLLDKPVIFYAYDLDDYVATDRSLYFDYEEMACGAICRDQAELEKALIEARMDPDQVQFAEQRSRVKSFTHDYQDGNSSARLLANITAKLN